MKKPTIIQFRALLTAAVYCTSIQTKNGLSDNSEWTYGGAARNAAWNLWNIIDKLRKEHEEFVNIHLP